MMETAQALGGEAERNLGRPPFDVYMMSCCPDGRKHLTPPLEVQTLRNPLWQLIGFCL